VPQVALLHTWAGEDQISNWLTGQFFIWAIGYLGNWLSGQLVIWEILYTLTTFQLMQNEIG